MNHEQNSHNFFLGMKIKFNIKIKKKVYKYLKKMYIVIGDESPDKYVYVLSHQNIQNCQCFDCLFTHYVVMSYFYLYII